jgi:hypothetical protein
MGDFGKEEETLTSLSPKVPGSTYSLMLAYSEILIIILTLSLNYKEGGKPPSL